MTTHERGQDVHDSTAGRMTLETREWMLANGAGGSAHGERGSVPLRPGHAWLHAAGRGGEVITVLLGLDERARTDQGVWDLADWPGRDPAIPLATLEEFEPSPWPAWRFRCGDAVVERSLFLVHGHQALIATYRHLEGPAVRLRLSPLVVGRDPDGAQREHPDFGGLAQGIPGRVRIETYAGGPTLTLWHQGSFMPNRMWRRGIEHPHESRRSHEDALVPGHFDGTLVPSETLHVVASTEDALFRALAVEGRLGTPPPATLAACVAALAADETARQVAARSRALKGADTTARQAAAAHGDGTLARRPTPLIAPGDPWALPLARAIEQGLARRDGRLTLLDPLPAGTERGSATLRALPGLVSIRAFEPVREVLRGLSGYLDDGLAPSSFDAEGRPRYQEAEPSLWMIHATELLARRSEDAEWVRDLYPPLESVLQYYRGGTRGGIRVGADGLLQVGEDQARLAGLNALWYHALVAMAQLARLTGRKENAAFYLAWARQHGQCFNERFWDEATGSLHDAWSEQGPIPGLAPSHLLAVSLTPPLLAPERAARLVARIERELFTPLGLRPEPGASLVEPAWLGAFCGAYLRAHGRSPEARSAVRGWLDTLRVKLDRVAPGYVPAAFEGPAPRRGSRRLEGTAWVAEARPRGASPLAASQLLRVWIEEVTHAAEPAPVA